MFINRYFFTNTQALGQIKVQQCIVISNMGTITVATCTESLNSLQTVGLRKFNMSSLSISYHSTKLTVMQFNQ